MEQYATPPRTHATRRDVYASRGANGQIYVTPLPFGGISFWAPRDRDLYPNADRPVVYYARTRGDGTLGEPRSALLVRDKAGDLQFGPWQGTLKWPYHWRQLVELAYELRDLAHAEIEQVTR